MGKLVKSMLKGSKWIAKKALPVLAYGYGAGAGLAANQAASALDKPKPVETDDPALMPDEIELRRARRRATALRTRSGRSSTILSNDSEDQL